jgi:hypothetical protein
MLGFWVSQGAGNLPQTSIALKRQIFSGPKRSKHYVKWLGPSYPDILTKVYQDQQLNLALRADP